MFSSIFLDLSAHSNGSDCGYSSSMEGSETGSREGSDIACSEGICNHEEAGLFWEEQRFLFRILFIFLPHGSLSSEGDDPNLHHCAEDKEEDGMDSCVDCWPHSEENAQCKSKKKKRKGKVFCSNEVRRESTQFCFYCFYMLYAKFLALFTH